MWDDRTQTSYSGQDTVVNKADRFASGNPWNPDAPVYAKTAFGMRRNGVSLLFSLSLLNFPCFFPLVYNDPKPWLRDGKKDIPLQPPSHTLTISYLSLYLTLESLLPETCFLSLSRCCQKKMLRKQLKKGDENKYLESFNQALVTGVFHFRILLLTHQCWHLLCPF